jgi:hypothetical protein
MSFFDRPVCVLCKHLDSETLSEPPLRCSAFPEGVPADIAAGRNDHTASIPGDRGIRFEPLTELTSREAELADAKSKSNKKINGTGDHAMEEPAHKLIGMRFLLVDETPRLRELRESGEIVGYLGNGYYLVRVEDRPDAPGCIRLNTLAEMHAQGWKFYQLSEVWEDAVRTLTNSMRR